MIDVSGLGEARYLITEFSQKNMQEKMDYKCVNTEF